MRKPPRLANRWHAIKEWAKHPLEKNWTRKKRILIWTTLMAALATSAGTAYFRAHPREWRIAKVLTGITRTAPVTIQTKDGQTITYHKAPSPIEAVGSGDMCLRYARLVAAEHGYKYRRTDAAWTFAESNKTVWKKDDRTDYQRELKPFRIIGIYNPQSENNRPGREFTHVALYLGKANGEHIIAHNMHGNFRLDTLGFVLNDLLSDGKQHGEVRRIFAPTNE